MLLLILLFFCHFLADFTHLSTNKMLSAKRFGNPLFPIFCHAAVHAFLMGIVLHIYIGGNFMKFDIVDSLILIQLFSHFAIDVLKGKINYFFPVVQSPLNKVHWIVFGADQFLHSVVIVVMAEIAFG